MRIEQYFLMTDYSLWEVILNGDSPVPTRIVEGVLQPVAPTTAEQRNKADLEEQNLDNLFNSLKIYKTEVKQSSAIRTATQNLAFGSSSHTDSTTDSVSAAASVFAACAKLPASPLPNVDSLSNAVIYPFFASQSTSPHLDNEDLKKIDVDNLEEMDLRWQMAMLTMWARRFLQKTGRNLGANGPKSMGFDMSKVECYNCHRKGHFARKCRSSKDPRRPEEEPANFALMSFSSSSSDNETGQESVEARLLVYKQNESVFKENIKLLNIDVQLRDTALATLRQKLDKAEKDRDDLKLKLENFQTSSKNLTELLASQTKSDCESWPPSSLYDRFQPSGGYHAVPPPYTGTFMPPKPDLQIETTILVATLVPASPKSNSSGQRRNRKACFVCKSVDHLIKDCDFHTKKMAQPTQKNYAHRGHHKQYALLNHSKPQQHLVLTAVLTQSKPVSNTAVKPVSAALPNIIVPRPRHAHHVVTKFKSPIKRHITHSPSSKTSNSPPRVTAGNPQQALKDKRVIDSGCSRHMTGNMSYLSKFEELNGGYVAFGGNPKGGKITGKGKIKTCKLDFDDVYFVKELKFNLFSVSQMRDKKNSVLFTDTECLVYLLTLYCLMKVKCYFGTSHQNGIPERKNMTLIEAARTILADSLLPIPIWAEAVNTACYVQNRVLVTKPHNQNPYELLHGKFQRKVDEGFLVGYSICSKAFRNNDRDATFDGKEHDFDAKKPDSEVILSPSNLNAKFEDCSDNSSNEVNAARSIVPTVGKNTLNSTNTFSAVGPLNTIVSPTYGKSSSIDAYQLPDDPDMPELEDITYSDDEDVVGAEADFNNLESSIPEEPNRVHQALKDSSWIEAIQEELLQFKMQKVWVLVDLPYRKRSIDDIIFDAPNKDLCRSFEKLMEDKFQMSSIRELTFFLGLQVKQKKDGIFINQDKYVAEILKKFRLTERKSASTPIDTEKPLLKDSDGEDVDVHTYRSMIGSLMYLTSSRPGIMFASDDVTRLQALVDRKKVVITEAAIKDVLRLDDAEGVDCLPTKRFLLNWLAWVMRSHP
nr:hypothetical protein [Tanacetum cinerariifolium]